jgi:ribosome biogenesis protein NSA1
MRLAGWRLAPGGAAFAYAGDEVEASLWSVERAFADADAGGTADADGGAEGTGHAAAKKRKRARDALLPGELWRAKNVANDELSLRVPVHNTCLAFVLPAPGAPAAAADRPSLLVGTRAGKVRRYDPRAARRPVADWAGIVKQAAGGVKGIEAGVREQCVWCIHSERTRLSATQRGVRVRLLLESRCDRPAHRRRAIHIQRCERPRSQPPSHR